MSSYSSSHGQTIPKSRSKVKPILRKFTANERTSLDLDRPATEQGVDGLGIYDYGTGSLSSHDQIGRRPYHPQYQHRRTTSGTSQFSTESGHRTNHPFAQTPRPYTPPISAASHQNSLRESEYSNSPVQTEDEEAARYAIRSTSTLSNRTTSLNSSASPVITSQPPLRLQTKQPALSSRLAQATSSTSLDNYLSPISPVEIVTPASNMRTSFEKSFRVRSHSHQDSRPRNESIVEARRKFQEKEKAKDEKAAREEVRLMEKRNEKEARKIERGHRRSSASESRAKRSKSDLTIHSEKGTTLVGHDYHSAPGQSLPYTLDSLDGHTNINRDHNASASAKKKTHSAWTKFMMWFRTRFIRMSKKTET